MFAGDLYLQIFKILILLSLTNMITSQICMQKHQEEMLVKRNGKMEKVLVDSSVKICCEGYTIDKMNPSKCVSICPEGFIYETGSGCLPRCDECENGTCLAPNDCQCDDDYVAVKSGCAPICENECKYGYCAKPGICACNKGYVQSSGNGSCIPICENCENGFCERPGECQCKPGYKWNERKFKCRPICKKPCEYGYCSAPDTCACKKGYRHSSLNPHVCLPDNVGYNEITDDAEVVVPSSELPEIEGIFRYLGKKVHFVGHFDGIEDDKKIIL